MKVKLLESIMKLRIAVGYMIENESWWNTQFFTPTANDFLTYIFPKSTKENSTFFLEAIRLSVDSEVGANYYHLFRLPVEIEEQLHKISLSNDELINNKQIASKILKELTDGLIVDQNMGPVNIGASDQLGIETVQIIAAQYYSAFNNNYKVHPYLN
jgi:hypothetical protein